LPGIPPNSGRRTARRTITTRRRYSEHLEYIDKRIQAYNQEVSEADGDAKETINAHIEKHKGQRKHYERIDRKLQEDNSSENPQLSTSDPDSRHQIVRGTITEVSYTTQTTVEAHHKLLIDYKIKNRNEFTRFIAANAQRIKESGDTYKKRQALVEHRFGTIKRQWASTILLPRRECRRRRRISD
jgi:hypothetical protein